MNKQNLLLIQNARNIYESTDAAAMFIFLATEPLCRWFLSAGIACDEKLVVILPQDLPLPDSSFTDKGCRVIRSWTGNQSRFSRIKYAFLRGVLHGIITTESRIVCVLGPWARDILDTLTVHDLATSWSEEFPFFPLSLIKRKSFDTILSVIDIALDICAVGREGRSVGTCFVIGDSEQVLKLSEQATFNPFRGYPESERKITRQEVVESIKELAQLDGAFVITDDGTVEAAARHLVTKGGANKQLRGLGSRHRAAAGITRETKAVSIVVSETSGRITVFDKGRVIASLDPIFIRRSV